MAQRSRSLCTPVHLLHACTYWVHICTHIWDLKDSKVETPRGHFFTHTCNSTIPRSYQVTTDWASIRRGVDKEENSAQEKLYRVHGSWGREILTLLQCVWILEDAMTGERSQTQKDEMCMSPVMWALVMKSMERRCYMLQGKGSCAISAMLQVKFQVQMLCGWILVIIAIVFIVYVSAYELCVCICVCL